MGSLCLAGQLTAQTPQLELQSVRVEKESAGYVSFVPEESVFPQALKNFDRMRAMAGNTT